MRLRRLARMRVSELAGRSRQEALKRLERAGWATLPAPRLEVSLADWQAAAPGRFFQGAASAAAPSLVAARWPAACESITRATEQVCRKRFDLLGYRDLSFGDPVDWHLDPVSGRRAPLVHWSRLDPLDATALGDSKVIWELNRHQWLVGLGCAYQLSGDERYAAAVAGFIGGWIAANPPAVGINWASSLEVALRLISWCWAVVLLRGSKALSAEFFAALLASIRRHALHVERYLSHYFSPNTHLTGEALGLFYAGVLFSEMREASRWRRLGARILVAQIERQVLPDGVHFEQSTCYQRYTIEIYLHFLILAARNGVAIPDQVAEQVQKMLDFLLAMRRPDGSMPQIGDADGGWLLPLMARAPDDARAVFSLAAAFFCRADYAWAGGATPEIFWMLGPAGLDAVDSLAPSPPADPPSRLFADGGYVVMRSGWDAEAHHLILDAGPIGCPASAGHGHADLLSLQCSAFGEPFIMDPGTYCYTTDPGWRDHFRSTAAHSTVTLDGVDQTIPAGPFAWQSRPRARLRRWLSTEALDFADSEHDAYRHLPDLVIHRRRVLFVKPLFWVIVDDLDGTAEHRIDLRFQFAPMDVTLEADLWARAHGPRGHGLLVRPFATVPVKGEILEGCLDPAQGWISPHYGQRRPAPLLVYSSVATLPFRIVTLLWPTADTEGPVPIVHSLVGDGPGPDGLLLESTRRRIRFDEPMFVVERG
jgi:Heparinase II/III-like protein/Heparinase II/III N-terminus